MNLRENQTRTTFSFGMEGHMIIIIHSICPKTYFKTSVVENPSRKNGLFIFRRGGLKNGLLSSPDKVWISRIKMALESRALTSFFKPNQTSEF